MPANPLELIADWLLARFPFEALADQLGVSEQRLEQWVGRVLPEPATATLREPTAMFSQEEDRLARELLKATLAEQSGPHWSCDTSTAGITLPAISAQLGPRTEVRLPWLRTEAQKAAWAAFNGYPHQSARNC